MSLDDKNLIDRVVEKNDHRAFEELMKRYQSQVRYSLRQLTGWDEALADDLAQETFIKAYKSLHQFRGDAKFFTWLYRIAYHCFAAHYRSRKPEQTLDETRVEEGSYNPQHDIDVHRDFAKALTNLSANSLFCFSLMWFPKVTASSSLGSIQKVKLLCMICKKSSIPSLVIVEDHDVPAFAIAVE